MLTARDYTYSNPNSKPQGNGKIIPFINYHIPAPERCLNMLLAKYRKEQYCSEVMMSSPQFPPLPKLGIPLNRACLLLITDGGLVPAGNPGKMPQTNADAFHVNDISGKQLLTVGDYEVSHQGYDNAFVLQNPNRLLPVDILREMEQKGVIGRLCDEFISTTGVMMPTERSKILAANIARYVKTTKADAVIISSACGTSTRCGSYIALALEKQGIPVVQVTNLNRIAEDIGVRRVVKGVHVCYPFGDPLVSEQMELVNRRSLVQKALEKLLENDNSLSDGEHEE